MKILIFAISLLFNGLNFAFAQQNSSFTDVRDGKTYQTISIGNLTVMTANLAYKPVTGNYWIYKEEPENLALYGYLYDWETAKTVCPPGWHLPNKTEIAKLLQHVGGEGEQAGKALLANGTSGFNALLAGYRNTEGAFFYAETNAFFWTSTPEETEDAWHLSIIGTTARIQFYYATAGYSVRCFSGNVATE